jgi:rhodanese-related sulfurtransferase
MTLTIDGLLTTARSTFERISPYRAHREAERGAVIVDIRPDWQRDTEIPGSLIIERNHLEWRLHPESDARLPVADTTKRWVLVCSEGYASSLAAASLVQLGLDATDIVGGIAAWQEVGLPVVSGPTDVGRFVG